MHSLKSNRFLTRILFASLLTYAFPVAQAQTFKVLHAFHGVPGDGDGPVGPLVRDAAGNLYGTTNQGGSVGCFQFGCGTVFMLNKSGEEVGLFGFDGRDGANPFAGLFRDSVGNLYGTTYTGGAHECHQGGPQECGTAFELNSTGTKIRYYSFSGTPDGDNPKSSLIEVSGSFYGTTYYGGTPWVWFYL